MKPKFKYQKAWYDFLKRFDGAYDGVSHAAERGSDSAVRDEQVYREIREIIEEVAEEHDIEHSVHDIEGR